MNKLLTGLAVALVAVSLVLSVAALTKPGQVVIREIRELGAAGSEFSNVANFVSGLFTSGFKDLDRSVPTLTGAAGASSTRTLTAAEVCDNSNSMVNIQIRTATGTVTLPSALLFKQVGKCLSDLGDSVRLVVRNSSSSIIGGTFDIVAGASSTLYSQSLTSSTLPGSVVFASTSLRGSNVAELEGFRFTSTTDHILWKLEVFGF